MLIVPPTSCFEEGGGLSQSGSAATGLAQTSTLRCLRAGLPAETQLLDQGAVALEIVFLEIVQETTATADELEQPAA
jgi:hypothetical protein